jgi:4-hydroxy-3-methylbut-2-enyl diphosphate reductase
MEIILGKTSGFCFGVKNAIDGAENELKNSKNKVYCLGEIIHNEEVIKDLKNKGLKIVNDINDAFDKIIIRAHGVPKEVYEIGKKRNIEILDFTCPFVLKIHDTVVQYSKNNYFIFLLGVKNHPETIGTISFCGNNSHLIENSDDIPSGIDKFNKSGLKKILVVSQTTFSVSLFDDITQKIKNQLSTEIELEIKNTICNTTSIRQKETENISKEVDLMIVVGGKNSSNTKKLYEISQKNCENVLLVQTKNDLDYEYLQRFSKIGIIAGASTPQSIIDDIVLFCKK